MAEHKKQLILESAYSPSPWGQEFHTLPHEYALGAGSAGPGKSMVLLMEPLSQIICEHERCYRRKDHDFPLHWGESIGWALHLRRTLPMLKQTLQRAHRIFPAIDPGVRWIGSENTFVFSSGYRYEFGHCNDADSWQQFYSSEFSIILYDELTQFLEEQWDQINSRRRSSDPVLRTMTKTRAMSNPVTRKEGNFTVTDPNWVRRLFVDPAPEGRKTIVKEMVRGTGEIVRERRIYLPATLYDNPDKEFVKTYEATLLGMKPHQRQALLYGNWYFTTGSFFEEWDDAVHVRKAFAIPEHWPVFRSMDWGFKKPGCVHWWALDEDDNLYCFHELTFRGQTDEEVAAEIRKVEINYGLWKHGKSLITGPADTQLWEKRGESARSKAEVMASKGVYWVTADKKSKKRNCELLTSRLKDRGLNGGHPGICFFESCRDARKTIPSIQTETQGADADELPKDGGEDHWLDSTLYACAYASRGRDGLQQRTTKSDEEDDEEHEQRRIRRGSRGRDGYGSTV
jgi:hypothetical protein